ncbi:MULTISPECIES: hypothetical protein [unclassified Okeania]|uniref:hypothetical protein n=1 Tax=unclassified Okeania TaxID=2634635 RepID=UPI0013BDB95F|nr:MULTISPECIES: hypothetical protein [unclassified Okeania]NET23767.1 hypothetical protein [Okeania sp. SIO1H5]NET97566.1 hypothetical protein [Okeania sp. SIO1H2]
MQRPYPLPYAIAEGRDEYKWDGYLACGENIRNGGNGNGQDAHSTKRLKSPRIYATLPYSPTMRKCSK